MNEAMTCGASIHAGAHLKKRGGGIYASWLVERALNFSAATALFHMSAAAAGSGAEAFPALVAAGVGLRKCGEAPLAAKLLRYALEREGESNG